MKKSVLALSMGFAVFAMGAASAADPVKIEWSKIKATSVPLFYPGQSSYEWLRSDAHKGANKEVTRGDACVSCHDEKHAEKDMGEKIVKGGPLEPTPVKGKSGYKDLSVQAAYDAKNLYLRYEWKTDNPTPVSNTSTCALTARSGRSGAFPSSTRWCRTASSPASMKTACPSSLTMARCPALPSRAVG